MNSPQALAEYARSTDVWVCASETLGSRWPYKEMLERDATHVAMVDLCWTGGLTEGRKIAALAETWHRPFAPHDCIGPVGFAAAVHASFSQPNTLIQESVRAFYTGWYKELVSVVPTIKDGYVFPMEGAGPRSRAASCSVRASRSHHTPLSRLRHRAMSIELFSLKGRTALVTGSSRGLGRAMAEGMAAAGATIVLNGSDPGRLGAASAEMKAAGFAVHEACFDVTDEAAVLATFTRLDDEGIDDRHPRQQRRHPIAQADGRACHRRVAKSHRRESHQRLRHRA